MNLNIWGDFQFCISVPLREHKFFVLFQREALSVSFLSNQPGVMLSKLFGTKVFVCELCLFFQDSGTGAFLCICKIFKSTFFTDHLLATASVVRWFLRHFTYFTNLVNFRAA